MVANRNTQISKAVVKLRELSADEKARDMYERQEKARRDYEWAVDYAVEKGRQQWLQEGRQEGLQAGRQKERQELIKRMKLSGMSEAEIEKILKL